MKFDGFEIHASPHFNRVHCKQCGSYCTEVPDGWFSSAFFCPKCEVVYTLKLVKVPSKKLPDEYLEQCRKESAKAAI